jgi:hypothetical protein
MTNEGTSPAHRQGRLSYDRESWRMHGITRTKDSIVSGPRGPGRIRHSDQVPGAIWALFSGPAPAPERWKLETEPDGTEWFWKGRYFIIVRVENENIYEVPIYTCYNKGLNGIPQEDHYRYFAVCPKHAQIQELDNVKDGDAVLQIDWTDVRDGSPIKLDRTTMKAKWDKVLKWDINEEPLQLIAKLTDASRDVLTKRCIQV